MTKREQIKQLIQERDHARALACQYEEEISRIRGVEMLDGGPFDLETWMRRAHALVNDSERHLRVVK